VCQGQLGTVQQNPITKAAVVVAALLDDKFSTIIEEESIDVQIWMAKDHVNKRNGTTSDFFLQLERCHNPRDIAKMERTQQQM
jgi:hypothetical protein